MLDVSPHNHLLLLSKAADQTNSPQLTSTTTNKKIEMAEEHQSKGQLLLPATVSSSSPTRRKKTIPSTTNPNPRRKIPEDKGDLYLKDDDEPTSCDVVSGRGGCAVHHEGNRPYWKLILQNRHAYRNSRSDQEKAYIARSIVDQIQFTRDAHGQFGRFLQRENRTRRWFVLPDKVALDKVKQALRDQYVPLWARESGFYNGSTSAPASPKAPQSAQVLKRKLKGPSAGSTEGAGITTTDTVTEPSKPQSDDFRNALHVAGLQPSRNLPYTHAFAGYKLPSLPNGNGIALPSSLLLPPTPSLDALILENMLSLDRRPSPLITQPLWRQLRVLASQRPIPPNPPRGGADWVKLYKQQLGLSE